MCPIIKQPIGNIPMNKSMPSKIKVMLVDDHKLLRDGLASILSHLDDISVVGSVGSGEQAINEVDSLNPDIILMDIMMCGMTGIEATRWIKEQNPTVKIVLVSSEVNQGLVSTGIQVGIDGYLPKDVSKDVLGEAIRSVMNGNSYFAEQIARIVFEEYYEKNRTSIVQANVRNLTNLTSREMEILILIAAGMGNKQISEELLISVKTVETHKAHVFDKLNLKNTAELVKYALRNNLITLDE